MLLLQAALDATGDAIVIVDSKWHVIGCSRACLDLFGLTLEQTQGVGVDAVLDAADRLLERPDEIRTVLNDSTLHSVDVVRFKDGRVFERHVAPLSRGSRVAGRILTYRDITAAETARRELAQSRSLFDHAQKVAHVGSWVAELDGSQRLVWSAETSRIFGVGEGDFPETFEAFYAYVHADDRESVRQTRRRMVEEGAAGDVEYRIVRPDGEVRWMHGRADIVRDGGRVVRLIGTVQDVTDRRRLEEQLRQAQKLEAIGRLAGGVAHDLNNALTSIVGYTELALGSLAADHPARADVLEIRRAAERTESVTRQLLAFSRKQQLRPQVFSLTDSVASVARMLDRFLVGSVQVEVAANCDAPFIHGDPGQIEQAIVNLAVNARDAMPDGGRLALAVRTVEVAAAAGATHDPIPAGQYVELAVSDTGSGMSPNIMAHIFEPFFTTKDVGKGTGLGLAMVYGTVKQSGGFIDVESEVGRGTTFRLRFPPAPPGEVRVGRQAAPNRATPPTEATVLIVEDEGAVRNLVLVTLAQRGYRLLSAATAQEALDLAATEEKPVDLLLTDANMPGMNGVELVSRLVARWPTLPVILMSGFTEDLETLAGLADQMTLLPKPFTPRQLREHVERSLARRR